MRVISLYGACSEDIFSAEEPWVLEVNPDTIGYVWMGEFDLNTLRIRVDREIFESGKKNLRIKNIRIPVDGA